MVDKVISMRSAVVWWALLVGLAGCTKPNPRSCADGSCTDPEFPFCDVDGALEGQPDVCIAVACTPSEVAECRGDQAVTCNADGNNYDLVQCPLGCDIAAGGCLPCSDNQQCSNPSPICDASEHQCRACTTDDECASAVCDAGICVEESTVVYAAATGAGGTACTHAQPCLLQDALVRVSAAAVPSTLRLLPGTYATTVQISAPATVSVVATGATLTTSGGVVVDHGASVKLRGAEIQMANNVGKGILCGDASAHSALSVDSVKLSGARQTVVQVGNCTLRMTNSEIAVDDDYPIYATADATFEGDRLRVHSANPGPSQYGVVTLTGQRVSFKLTNSVLEDVVFGFQVNDSTPPGSKVSIAHNTLVTHIDGFQHTCNTSAAMRTLILEDNIIVSTAVTDTFTGTGCTLRHNVLFPQATPYQDNLAADPQFVDMAARNFHLKPTSPAVDAAMPSAGLSTDHDFDGKPRPQGSAPDIGAFELAP